MNILDIVAGDMGLARTIIYLIVIFVLLGCLWKVPDWMTLGRVPTIAIRVVAGVIFILLALNFVLGLAGDPLWKW